MPASGVIFTTERLTVRSWVLDDLPDLTAILSDARTMAHWPEPLDDAGVKDWFDRSVEGMARHGCARWCCELTQTGTVVGDVGIVFTQLRGKPVYDLGYIIASSHWGRGLGYEAARGAVVWAQEQGIETLVANMAVDNAPSVATAEKLGFTRIETFVNDRNRRKPTYWYELKLVG